MNNILNSSDLSSIALTHTSKGVLFKWTSVEGGKKYYYKSGKLHYGTFSNLEPIAECIACEIAKIMGIATVQYELTKVCVSETEDYESQEIVVCKSEDFLNINESFVSMYQALGGDDKEDFSYKRVLETFPDIEESLNVMLLFDFLINNTDRHLNNFGLIQDNDGDFVSMGMIFDNGASLYSDLNYEDLDRILNTPYGYKKYDKSKPFKNKHYKQIGLLVDLPKINLDFKNDEIFKVVDKYHDLLGERRTGAIKLLLERRIGYVRELYTKK